MSSEINNQLSESALVAGELNVAANQIQLLLQQVEKRGQDIDSTLLENLAAISAAIDVTYTKIMEFTKDRDVREEYSNIDIFTLVEEVLNSGQSRNWILTDGTCKTITQDLAKTIMDTYSELNEANQEKLKILLCDSQESFEIATHFAKTEGKECH